MGLRAASTSIPSSSASENVSPIHQQGVDVDVRISLPLVESQSYKKLQEHQHRHLNTTYPIVNRKISEIEKHYKDGIQEKDSKDISNVSVQSNMAPALTEPLSPANKLSSSTTSASPRPIPNSQLTVNRNNNINNNNNNNNTSHYFSSININGGNTSDLIDIETELLKVTEGSFTLNGGSAGGGIGIGSTKIKNTTGIYTTNSISKGVGRGNIASSKGAFQLAFEQVIAKQRAESAATIATTSSSSLPSPSSLNSTFCNTNTKQNSLIPNCKSLVAPIYCEKFSRQMGPMCDTNNLSKSHLLDTIATGSGEIDTDQQATIQIGNSGGSGGNGDSDRDIGILQQEKVDDEAEGEAEEKHMDLINYDDNEDSQQDNAQGEINSSSSTVTAENTDVEDNIPFPGDVGAERVFETIVVNNEEVHRRRTAVAQETFEKLQRTPPSTATSNIIIGTSQSLEQQQQSQSQHQMTTPICSLTPQSITSVGGLSSQKDFIKDSAEMDQVLGDMDLLQVLKGFDSAPGGENLCELAGSLGLFNDVDVMNYEEMGTPAKDSETREIRSEIERRQQQMQRKCDFLLRRLRKIQARYMGRHASEEVAGLFEWTNRIVRRKDREHSSRQILYEEDKRRPVSTASMRSFLKRLDVVATSQHSNHGKSIKMTATAGSGGGQVVSSSSTAISGSGTGAGTGGGGAGVSASKLEMSPVISAYDEKTTEDIGHVSGMLQTELKEVQSGIDSDVTESSSGGESADEMVTYNNQTQQSLSM